MRLSIHARLISWYTLVLSVVLTAFATGFYVVHSRSRIAQVDEELSRVGVQLARILNADFEEGLELAEAGRDAAEDLNVPGRSLAVFDAAGVLRAGRWLGLPHADEATLGERDQLIVTVEVSVGAFRLYRARQRYNETTYYVGLAESLEPLNRELAALRRALLGSFLLTLLPAVGGGWWIARAALRPVDLMATQARRINDRTPGVRLSAPNPRDELGLLAKAFNDLLARLESALSQQRQFMADASHELRTPVSIARTAIEVTLSRTGRPEEEYRDALAVVASQTRRLSRIVENLFTLARADAAGLPLDRQALYLEELVADCIKEARLLAGPKGIELHARGPTDLEIVGDEQLLRQMLSNLLDNAIRHTPSGGQVGIEIIPRPDAVEVTVTDTGKGIPERESERVFERFVRLDASRTSDGAGLGLPIARAIAEAHGGTLVLARSGVSGSTFLARLPLPERHVS